MRRAAKKDTNHNIIANALRDVGYSVADTSALGDDFPDLIVGGVDRRTGQINNWLVEVKTAKGKLKPGQEAFKDNWRGPYAVLRTVDDAYKLVGVL